MNKMKRLSKAMAIFAILLAVIAASISVAFVVFKFSPLLQLSLSLAAMFLWCWWKAGDFK